MVFGVSQAYACHCLFYGLHPPSKMERSESEEIRLLIFEEREREKEKEKGREGAVS